jgi:hypothetical protein
MVCTRIIMVLAVVLAFVLAGQCVWGYLRLTSDQSLALLIVYLLFYVPAFVALASLDRLLVAIRREEVFTAANVWYLRTISWCCFGAALACFIGCFLVHPGFLILTVLAVFFGIILRVVKNLFAAAVALKTENDFTI